MIPETIELHKASKQLELVYDHNQRFLLNAEYLRVHSPSAEVRGHHPDQATLQVGKENVGILSVAAVGNYALQINFDDQHNSGIYSWTYLRELCDKKENYWQSYLDQLQASGKNRDPDVNVIRLFDPN
ncbi:MAG: DUF971 domain-containing protein [Pseudomonadales bacterium]|nr:DUF971 domain-containing protein [Pseudomonadales bacterium]